MTSGLQYLNLIRSFPNRFYDRHSAYDCNTSLTEYHVTTHHCVCNIKHQSQKVKKETKSHIWPSPPPFSSLSHPKPAVSPSPLPPPSDQFLLFISILSVPAFLLKNLTFESLHPPWASELQRKLPRHRFLTEEKVGSFTSLSTMASGTTSFW